MRKTYILLTAILAVLFSSCAQTEPDVWGGISGVVKDFQNNNPLEGVKVTITSTGDSKITGSDGQFTFENLDAKEYTISFEKAGYLTVTQVVRVLAGETVSAHVQMKPNLLGIEVLPTSLDFGTDKSSLELTVTATNGKSVHFEVSTSDTWITVTPTSATVSASTKLTVLVDRNVAAGKYSGTIIITANSEQMTVPVYMQVAGGVKPVISVQSISEVGQTTAKINGLLTLEGGLSVSDYGVCYATTSNPTVNNTKISRGGSSSSQSFVCQLSGLTPGTQYHVRAYAVSDGNTYYGNEKTFTTSNGGGGGGGGGDEDYSSAKLKSTNDKLTIAILSCKRLASGNIQMETTILNTGVDQYTDFRVQAVGSGYSWDAKTYTTEIVDDFATDYGQYDLKMSLNGKEGNSLSAVSVPQNATKKFILTLKNVPEDATRISVHLASMFYGYPIEYAYLTYDNVPIYK